MVTKIRQIKDEHFQCKRLFENDYWKASNLKIVQALTYNKMFAKIFSSIFFNW